MAGRGLPADGQRAIGVRSAHGAAGA